MVGYEFREEVLCEHVWFKINEIMWIILILFVLNLLIKGYSWGYSPYFNQGQLSRTLRLTAHLCGPLRANIDNDSHDSQKKKFITPAVHSKETLFGAPILPRDSVDRAVNSKLNLEDTNDHQSLAGLERSMPTEFRVNSTSVKGCRIKENTEIVETVDTFASLLVQRIWNACLKLKHRVMIQNHLRLLTIALMDYMMRDKGF